MPQLNIFGFDGTITKQTTFGESSLAPKENIKPNIGLYFNHNNQNISAIATHHNDAGFVKLYVEKILNKTLTEIKVKKYPYHENNHFEVEGTQTPLIISTIRDDDEKDYNMCFTALSPSGKNTQIVSILIDLDQPINQTHFYDAKIHNIQNAMSLPDLKSHHIAKTNTAASFTTSDYQFDEVVVYSDIKYKLFALHMQFSSVIATAKISEHVSSLWRQDGFRFTNNEMAQMNAIKAKLLDIIPQRLDQNDDYYDLLVGDNALPMIDFNINNARLLQKDTTGTRKEITARDPALALGGGCKVFS